MNKIPEKRWEVFPEIPEDFLTSFKDYHPVVLQLLYNRGVINQKSKIKNQNDNVKLKIDEFLNPKYEEHLYDPFLMKDMEIAVQIIKETIKKNQKIAVWGDYDVDGITGVALLFEVLNYLGVKPINYIPSREDEGYGLNKIGIKKLVEEGAKLLISVDCGISSDSEIDFAQKLGLKVVVVDHHEPKGELPRAEAILNPKRKDDKYPFPELAAVGVAFKLAQALLKTNNQQPTTSNFLKWLLDLVALGTICDVVPLIDENRIFVKYGLIVLKKTRRIGLKALFSAAGILPENLNSGNIGYCLGPRLNAAGRLEHAKRSLELLLTRDFDEAQKITSSLNSLNSLRQDITHRVLEEIERDIAKCLSEPIFVFENDSWPASVVGVVASKIVDKYSRPAIILERKENQLKGSARSISSFNIINALSGCNDCLTRYGGHGKAAGLTLESKNLKLFKEKISEIAKKTLKEKDFHPVLKIDKNLKLNDLTSDFKKCLEDFEPFGLGNFEPIFSASKLKVLDFKTVGGNGNHLKLWVKDEDKTFEAIGFRQAERLEDLTSKEEIELAFKLSENNWNGQSSLQLEIVDIKNSNIKNPFDFAQDRQNAK